MNNNIPDNIIKKFNKVLFKSGDAVCFTWFGERCYGYVEKSKSNTWGIQYTVKMYDTKYPCGIEIDGYKTKYATGCILYNDTQSHNAEDLKRRADAKPNIYHSTQINKPSDEQPGSDQSKQVSTNPKGNRTKSKSNDRLRRTDVNPADTKIASNATIGASGTIDTRSSDSRMRRRNSKESSNTKPKKEVKKKENKDLEDAIKKQKDFLNGFVKKE